MRECYLSDYGVVQLEVSDRGFKSRADLDQTLYQAFTANCRVKGVRITKSAYAEMVQASEPDTLERALNWLRGLFGRDRF